MCYDGNVNMIKGDGSGKPYIPCDAGEADIDKKLCDVQTTCGSDKDARGFLTKHGFRISVTPPIYKIYSMIDRAM